MIIDCHFHVDESMLTLEKMIEGMDKNGVNKTALIAPMNETMFEVDAVYQRYLYTIFRKLLLHSPQLGLKIYDGLVRNGKFNLYGKSYEIFPMPNNELVAAAIERYPSRFLGWVTVNPLLSESVNELEFYLNKPGFIGVKVHPFMHNYSIKELDSIAEICESKGVPIIIHLSSERESYKYLPEKYPNLKIIYAHAGLPFWKESRQYIKEQPNVYVDTSSEYLNQSIVQKTVESLGYRKVLYGCDGPYGMKKFNEYDYSSQKRRITSLAISDQEKEDILGKNFLKIIQNLKTL